MCASQLQRRRANMTGMVKEQIGRHLSHGQPAKSAGRWPPSAAVGPGRQRAFAPPSPLRTRPRACPCAPCLLRATARGLAVRYLIIFIARRHDGREDMLSATHGCWNILPQPARSRVRAVRAGVAGALAGRKGEGDGSTSDHCTRPPLCWEREAWCVCADDGYQHTTAALATSSRPLEPEERRRHCWRNT